MTTDHSLVQFVREFASSVIVIVLVGALLFGASGVWPPMVAVESGSMEPHMRPGDLVFVMDEGRLVPQAAFGGTGVVTYEDGEQAGYRTFGDYGDVVVYAAPNELGPPIIHRVRFWVDEGENWYDRADPRYVRANRCGDSPDVGLKNCPAPHAGFITKGDANAYYDQAQGIADPVRVSWIRGTAEARVPYLGCIRLRVSGKKPDECTLG